MINEFHIKFGHRLPRNTEFPKKKKKKKIGHRLSMINEFHIKFGHRLPRNTEFQKKKKKKKEKKGKKKAIKLKYMT